VGTADPKVRASMKRTREGSAIADSTFSQDDAFFLVWPPSFPSCAVSTLGACMRGLAKLYLCPDVVYTDLLPGRLIEEYPHGELPRSTGRVRASASAAACAAL
jgi:hypothetical protein